MERFKHIVFKIIDLKGFKLISTHAVDLPNIDQNAFSQLAARFAGLQDGEYVKAQCKDGQWSILAPAQNIAVRIEIPRPPSELDWKEEQPLYEHLQNLLDSLKNGKHSILDPDKPRRARGRPKTAGIEAPEEIKEARRLLDVAEKIAYSTIADLRYTQNVIQNRVAKQTEALRLVISQIGEERARLLDEARRDYFRQLREQRYQKGTKRPETDETEKPEVTLAETPAEAQEVLPPPEFDFL